MLLENTFVSISRTNYIFSFQIQQNAERNQRDQGLPPESPKEGRQKCQDQEECRQHQVQGALLPILVHIGHQRQGEGREAEAVSSPRPPVKELK